MIKELLVKENLVQLFFLVVGFALCAFIVRTVFRGILKRKSFSAERKQHLRVLEKIIIWALAIVVIANVLSIVPAFKQIISSVLAGSGAVALIVSFAAQDTISNFVSGAIIAISKPFKVGDLVKYLDSGDEIIGFVEEIRSRHTVIRTYANTKLIVPNSLISSTAIANLTYNGDSSQKINIIISLTYESDIVRAMHIMEAVIMKSPYCLDRRTEEQKTDGVPVVLVKVIDFADSGILVKAWVWVKDDGAAIELKNQVYLELMKRFADYNIEFAYPHVQIVESK